MIEQSQHHAGKIFGITYFLSLLVIGAAFSRFYAPYLVWENGKETARHFITHEQSVRIYLAGAFLYGAGVIVQLTALYVILRQVNRGIALFAAFSRLIYVFFWFVLVLYIFYALRLVGGAGSLMTFGPDRLAALAGSQLDSSRDAYYIGMAFNGLIGSVCISVFPIALHSPSLGRVGRPSVPIRGVLRLCLSLLSALRDDSVSELVRVPADELRGAALPMVVVPRSQIARQTPGHWAGLIAARSLGVGVHGRMASAEMSVLPKTGSCDCEARLLVPIQLRPSRSAQ
jgi:hypothetical protein